MRLGKPSSLFIPRRIFNIRESSILIILFVFGIAISLFYGRMGFMPLDQSVTFDGGWRIVSGQLPLRDFTTPHSFIPIMLQALVFKILGVNWFAYCMHAAILNGLFCIIVYYFLEFLGGARILAYFRRYPMVIIGGNELLVISGIQEWPRRVRELRVQHGWSIISGVTAKQMADEIENIDISKMGPDDYILINENQDREAAYRWHIANDIRRKKISVKDKIIEFLRLNIGKQISGEELRYLAADRNEWPRRVRELRTENGWPIVTKNKGRPDLPIGVYVLEADRQSPEHDRSIPDTIRGTVLRRDNYQCTKCSWSHNEWNPSDPRHLELHHIKQHVKGGENKEENLTTLCTVCHDEIHRNDN